MCLVLWASEYHEKYKLVVAANRDEFYRRPTLPADFWPENPTILAGKDLKGGGTWMGITTGGRFATLTNYRDPSSFNPHAPSRGRLVQKYLEGSLPPEQYMQRLAQEGGRYNGYNLLAGTCDEMYYFSNRERMVRKVDKGVHGLSNSLIDVPWPKVVRGVDGLKKCLDNADIDVEALFILMADRERASDHDLPGTGVTLELERMLSPLFIESQDYGTRTTTVILVNRSNFVQFWERSFKPGQSHPHEVYYQFKAV